jgi:peptidase S41-like protein
LFYAILKIILNNLAFILSVWFSVCFFSGKSEARQKSVSNSNIPEINLSPRKIDDLVILGKVWGFLKYYHPAVASGKYNWDNELLKILPQIIEAKDQSRRNKTLSSWIEKLGNFESGKTEQIDSSKVKLYPDLAWINDIPKLGKDLSEQLNRIKNAKRENKSYYVALTKRVRNPVFKNEDSLGNISYPDAKIQLLSLYRYWNNIQYFYPYKYLAEKNWNNILPEYVPKFVKAPDELQYKLAVLSLIAEVHDTHADIWSKDTALMNYKGNNFIPVIVTFIENKAVVTDYSDKDPEEKPGLKKGDVIISINSKTIDEIIKEKLPLTPASNYPAQLRNIARDLLRTNDTLLKITYQRKDSIYSAAVACSQTYYSRVKSLKMSEHKDTCFKYLFPGTNQSSQIAYIYPGSIRKKYIPEVMPGFLKAKGMVVDLRCYPSEFIVFDLGKYLMPDATNFVKFICGDLRTPGLFTYAEILKVGEKNDQYYKGKIIIIVNEQTQSQAEYTAMAFRVAPNATVIGSTTAGADGNFSGFYLPGSIGTGISGIGVYYPDGRETQRVGIVPDIEVKPTIKGIREGRDELLEKAVELINGK